MSEQTEGAEVMALEDLLHGLLGPACEDVSDLDAPPCWTFAQRILASDWLAAREAAAEARGAERALQEAAEDVFRGPSSMSAGVPVFRGEIADWLRARAAAAGGAR